MSIGPALFYSCSNNNASRGVQRAFLLMAKRCIVLLLPIDLNPLLNWLLALLAGSSLRTTKYQLCDKSPVSWNVPLLSNWGINQRVIVLQVCAKSQRFESRPDLHNVSPSKSQSHQTKSKKNRRGRAKHTEVLVHSIRVVCPGFEFVLKESKLLRERLDVRWVFIE